MAIFRTKARAIDLLGKNQIADLPTAITELWKNGYDAYGDYLDAGLYRAGYKDVESDIFVLSDDGFGMSREDIMNKWIVIGTDNKKREENIAPVQDRFGKKKRIPLGEKGIGRLSVTYLGNYMLMITKKQHEPYQLLFMDWRVFENYDLYLDEVEIPITENRDLEQLNKDYSQLQKLYAHNFESESWNNFGDLKEGIFKDLSKYGKVPIAVVDDIKKHFIEKKHGTYFVIFDPIKEIVELEREQEDNLKEAQEKAAEQTRYVRSALSGLFNPFDATLRKERMDLLKENYFKTPSLQIYSSNGTQHDFLQIKEFFTPDEFEECEHWIDGSFDDNGVFEGKIKVFGKIEDYKYVPRQKPRTKIGSIVLKLAFWEGTPKNSSMTREMYKKYEEKGKSFSGLYVYRDGFRVLPYGRTDFDFLEFEKRRSNNAGRYYFSHRKMIGFVGISKTENWKLIDKSGREGFVSNEAYRTMKSMLIEFFIDIAKKRYGRDSDFRWDFLNQKKENEREKIINEEKKKNTKAIIALNKKVIGNRVRLRTEMEKIYQLEKELSSNIAERSILCNESKELLDRINVLKKEIYNLKIFVPADVTLTGYDTLTDNLYEYEEELKSAEKRIKKCGELAKIGVNIDAIKIDYDYKYKQTQKEIDKLVDCCQTKLKENFARIEKQIEKQCLNIEGELEYFSPQKINLSEEDILKKEKELEDYFYNKLREERIKFNTLFKRMSDVTFDNSLEETIEAYKSKEIELTDQIDNFYELAQVGMSIEVIDHQFNVLYAEMTHELNRLSSIALKSAEVAAIYSPLKMAFQHLESNHKMLMPMYRTTRRNKTIITGEEIRNLLIKFYGNLMKKEKVELICTQKFLGFEINSFESVIMPVFLNIVNNAIYWLGFASDYKRIKMDVKKDEILIMNSGPKMTYTELTKCFEIFYTKKVSGRGIGLYLAKKCLNSIGKDIYATNDVGYNVLDGACFVICNYRSE